MCLFKDKRFHPHNRPLIAKEDIVCYKILHLNYITKMFVTPYTRIPIPIECIQKNKIKRIPFKAEILNKFRFICRHVLGLSNIVTDGFIHTYSSEISYYRLEFRDCVFKCIIPKGTKYFIGEHENVYASEQIIFVEQLY